MSRLKGLVLIMIVGLASLALLVISQSDLTGSRLTSKQKFDLYSHIDTRDLISGYFQLIKRPVNPYSLTADITFYGDIFWGRRTQTAAMQTENPYDFPFLGLNTFDKQELETWVANLECPVTDQVATTYEEENLFKFNCREEFLPNARKWFDVFSLANNHTDNRGGQAGLDTTRAKLEEYDFQYFGHYDNAIVADACEIISVPIYLDYPKGAQKIFEDPHIPLAMCGSHSVIKLITDQEIKAITPYSELFYTVEMPHQGVEYLTDAGDLKKITYRKMIDAGADVVIGGHPHAVQQTEYYKDKLIVHSIGNFIFDQRFSWEVTHGVGIKAKLSVDYDENIGKWIELAPKCLDFKDNCLELAKQIGLTKPEFKVEWDMVASDSSGPYTKKANEVDAKTLKKRLAL